mmetsp:Transcript_14153/g.21743  ORF Transcript_14153/g.21743 Transcript_14153/m.21743 type:complete len:450 (+) Transcript_14153:14-1363(+)
MTSTSVKRALYRSLLRSVRPFTPIYASQSLDGNTKALPALLYRSWVSSMMPTPEEREEKRCHLTQQSADSSTLFHSLLIEAMVGDAWMRFPLQIDSADETLVTLIRREFRRPVEAHTHTVKARVDCAFQALCQLNQKLSWAETLSAHAAKDKINTKVRPAEGVRRINAKNAFQAGAYLIAHPLQTGYFSKTVVVILDHSEEGGTYGLIINRSKEKTFQEILQVDGMPEKLVESFGKNEMRDGGPVHVSIQMMYSCSPDEEAQYALGGSVLPFVAEDYDCSFSDSNSVSSSTKTSAAAIAGRITVTSDNLTSPEALKDEIQTQAMHSDEAIFFRGNVGRASELVLEGSSANENETGDGNKRLNSHDFSFFSGSSVWESGQLESEIERGFWLTASGPPTIALSGEYDDFRGQQLWLSMLSALGEAEGDLARLLINDDGNSPNGKACDVINI